MNVKMAVQLLSSTTSKALTYFGKKGLFSSANWCETSKFISLVDTWFDLMNSRALYDKKVSRNAYGVNESHKNVLEEMISTMTSLKVCGQPRSAVNSKRTYRILQIIVRFVYDVKEQV